MKSAARVYDKKPKGAILGNNTPTDANRQIAGVY